MTTTRPRTIHDDGSGRGTDGPAPARARTRKVQEAVEARDALATALTRAGIQLPAMDVRTPWGDPESGPDEGDAGRAARYALVHLGVCSAPVALALAAVITKGAAR